MPLEYTELYWMFIVVDLRSLFTTSRRCGMLSGKLANQSSPRPDPQFHSIHTGLALIGVVRVTANVIYRGIFHMFHNPAKL